MKTTQTVSLNGQAFALDIDAYNMLQSYLQSVEHNLGPDTDKDEVMQDIEARIAELFVDIRARHHKWVISVDMVRAVVDQLGKPDDFKEDDDVVDPSMAETAKGLFKRHIYRDADNNVVGGVCAGLAHWIGIDPIWIRLVFVLCTFLYGFAFVIYLLLWLIIPEAKTAAQRLEMRGEQATIDNIQQEVVAQNENGASSAGSRFGDLMLALMKICLWAVGGFFLCIAILVVFVMVKVVLGMLLGFAGISPLGIIDMFSQHDSSAIMVLSVLLLMAIAIPIVGLIYFVVCYAKGHEGLSRKWVLLILLVWVLSVLGCIGMGIYQIFINPEFLF